MAATSQIKIDLFNFALKILKRIGFERFHDSWKTQYYYFIEHLGEACEKGVTSVVFSRDRAMQLHAFLSSYNEMVSNPTPTKILYKATSDAHLKSYQELQKIFPRVDFIHETNFRSQLIDLVKSINMQNILFFVDDMIFIRPVDFNNLGLIDAKRYIASISIGKDYTFGSVLLKNIKLPKFTNMHDGWYQFKWDSVKELCEWSYPLTLPGYMFDRNEILSIFESIRFKAPNSLENNMQIFRELFMHRLGLCFEYTVAPCVHVNSVQSEYPENPVLGFYDSEDLLKYWEAGKQIDYQKLYNQPLNIVQKIKYEFISRQKDC